MTCCRGIRGATTVTENSRDAILQATRQMLALMIRRNGIESADVASVLFTVTKDLDAEFPDRPVWLRRIDGHAGWANTAAMEIAGIDNDTPDPVGGKIIRDAGPMNAGTTIIAFVEDPDGYPIELIGRKG